MKRYWISALVIAGIVVGTFLLVETLDVGLLVDPTDQMSRGQVWAALIGGGLLLADVFIPVPSSVIMIAHGAILGIWKGFLVSFTASVAGAMLGWLLGRRCEGWVMKKVSISERERAKQMFERYGVLAIVISRMLPIVSETVSILSGLSRMDWKMVMVASALGSVPPALIYAAAGAYTTDFSSGSLVAVCVFAIAIASWLISRKMVGDRS